MSPRPGPVTLMTRIRSVVFYIYIALATIVIGAWGLPQVLRRQSAAHRVAKIWYEHLLFAARFWLGLTFEVRGTPPRGPALVAAKHQSFLDILILAAAVPQRAFIMKREVLRVPIMGWFARAVGCIPIDRSRGHQAMARIGTEVRARQEAGALGQIIIYPEGTRTLPGEHRRYKFGVAALAKATGLPVIPVAVNTGMFWPRKGFPIRSGHAIVEFMEPVPPEVEGQELLDLLHSRIEGRSDALMAEAGLDMGAVRPLA